MERLQKILAAAGAAPSRRRAEELITAGRVTVNAQVVTELGTRADPQQDVVAVDGVPVTQPAFRTIVLNKPAGYTTTRQDIHAERVVVSLVPDIPGLHPIGRLDRETTGLLLFTNDGRLTYALTHPKHEVEKTYRAWVWGNPSPAALELLQMGIALEDGMTAPARVEEIASDEDRTLLEVTIHEGRKRQVRRMLAAIDAPVISLARIRVGPIELGALPEGKWRDLTPDEIRQLYAAAGVELPETA